MTRPRVGVVALQGGVREHIELLASLDAVPVPLKQPTDLLGPDGLRVDAVVLPGGESSTIDRLLKMFGLGEPMVGRSISSIPEAELIAGRGW